MFLPYVLFIIISFNVVMLSLMSVMLSLKSVMSPPPALCNLSACTVVRLCTLGVFALGVQLGFLNCDDIYMCVVNKQVELLHIVYVLLLDLCACVVYIVWSFLACL